MNKNQPFILRLTDNNIPSWLLGIITSLFLVILQTVIFYVDNILLTFHNYWLGAFFFLSCGYLVFISRLINDNHRKGFKKLLEHTELDEDEKTKQVLLFDQQALSWKEMLIPIGIGCLHAFWAIFNQIIVEGTELPFYDIFQGVKIIILWIFVWQSTSTYIRNMTKMNKLSEMIKIDLLNIQKFIPLTSAGVISILAFTGTYTLLFINSVNFTDIDLYNPGLLPIIPTIIYMIITPLKGLRKRIIKAKENEIELIDKGIEGDWNILKDSRIGKKLDNINVIDLMTYKSLITNTNEFPINVPTAFRLVVFLIIPLLTWIAASIVDKFVDYLLTV